MSDSNIEKEKIRKGIHGFNLFDMDVLHLIQAELSVFILTNKQVPSVHNSHVLAARDGFSY
jgi:hypothetical protein